MRFSVEALAGDVRRGNDTFHREKETFFLLSFQAIYKIVVYESVFSTQHFLTTWRLARMHCEINIVLHLLVRIRKWAINICVFSLC